MSWAKDADAVMVRPATTARIVANATAEMMPSRTRRRVRKPAAGPRSSRHLAPRESGRDRPKRRRRTQRQGEQVEGADQPDRPDHRAAGLLGGRHGVEPHQHVRQARGAEDQGQGQRQEVDLRGQRSAVLRARGQHVRLATPFGGGIRDRRLRRARMSEKFRPNFASIITVIGGAEDQQHRLDDLHPGGALHAADQDVDDHQDADDRDDDRLAEPALTSSSRATNRRRPPSGRAGRTATPSVSTSRRPAGPAAASDGSSARRPW